MIRASLGSFLFHVWDETGPQPYFRQLLEVLERPGVPDADFRLLAFKGEAFQVVTEWNTSTTTAAWAALGSYQSAVAGIPLRLITDPADNVAIRVDFDTHALRVKVVDVVGGGGPYPAIRRVGGIVGGVNVNGFNVLLSATWTLKFVRYVPDP